MLFEKSGSQWNIGNAVTNRLTGHEALYGLIKHVDLSRTHGYQITREKCLSSNVGADKASREELNRLRKLAANWKDSGELRTYHTHTGFRQLQDDLFDSGSFIGKCLLAIADGHMGKAQEIFEANKKRFNKPSDTVNEFIKRSGEISKLDGKLKSWTVENINTTKEFIDKCLKTHVTRTNRQAD